MINYLERYAVHIRPEIAALINRGNVTYAEYAVLRMNTYERNAMLPALDDRCLVNLTEGHLRQCSQNKRYVPTTYDEVVISLIVPELLKRLERKNNGG